jgi:L-alanine-DL-glutamate epimerase-like enolase superfamily enzyme
MQIAKVDVIPVDIPLATPVRMATHTISRAANVLVRMESTDGVNLSGKIVPEGPGLGVDIHEQAIAHYRVADA